MSPNELPLKRMFCQFTRENDREDEEDVELKIIWMRIAILVSCSWTLKTI
jgi:hypothetical protein